MIADLLALGAAAAFGASDFSGGLAARRLAAPVVVVASQVIGVPIGIALALLIGGSSSGSSLIAGGIAGVAGGIGLVALYHGLAQGRMAVVAPVSAVVGTGVPVVYGVLGGERPDVSAWAGIVLALVAIVFISASGSVRGSGLRDAVIAGLGFAGFFIALSDTSVDDGLWPLIPARLASMALIGVFVVARRVAARPERGALAPVVAAGIGDMIANALYLGAVQRGLLTSAVVLSSLYPAFTVLLGRFVAHETVTPRQWLGLGLALCAVVLLAW
ncbi:MAG: DMT family transporter [Acidimicrobiia bacterium]|nr:DMT family transporter [Acidimicrobiia bacterium]MDH4309366.1 DMT family transporter [Acidimicrobiia bacterium]